MLVVLTRISTPSVIFQMGFSIWFSAVMQPWSRPVCGPASATVCVSAGRLRRRWRYVALFSVHHMFSLHQTFSTHYTFSVRCMFSMRHIFSMRYMVLCFTSLCIMFSKRCTFSARYMFSMNVVFIIKWGQEQKHTSQYYSTMIKTSCLT